MSNSTSSFTIMVQGAPFSSQAHATAINVVEACLRLGHRLDLVFFHGDAVHVASKLCLTPSDEVDLQQKWQDLASQHQFKLVVCSAAAGRRGVLCAEDAALVDGGVANLAPQFEMGGAASYFAAMLESDRSLVFR